MTHELNCWFRAHLKWILLVLLCPWTAQAGQWRWALGAQIDPASHGIIDLGYRDGGYSVELLTDTLDLRYRGRLEKGQWDIGLRAAVFGAELLFSPWQDNKPAPEDALRASYLGIDLSRAWWLGDGYYAALAAEYRLYQFGQWDESTRDIPKERGRLRTAVKVGRWHSELRAQFMAGYVRDGGFDGWWFEGKLSKPRGVGLGIWNQTHFGWSHGLTRLSKFRLGGLNPYVIPFAGLGWAQFWVERYAVQRVGLGYKAHDGAFDLTAGLDLGVWDQERMRVSPVMAASVDFGDNTLAASGGIVMTEEAELGVHGWSAFVWYERSWR